MLQADLAHKGKINMKLYDGPAKLLAITLRVGFTFGGKFHCGFVVHFWSSLGTLGLLFCWGSTHFFCCLFGLGLVG